MIRFECVRFVIATSPILLFSPTLSSFKRRFGFTPTVRAFSKMAYKTLEGYEQFKEFYENLKPGESVNFYFTGNKDSNGVSWCPDCVVGEFLDFKYNLLNLYLITNIMILILKIDNSSRASRESCLGEVRG